MEARTLTDNRLKKTEFRSFRLSPVLLDMIRIECQYRELDFSEYIRYAALAIMKHGNKWSRLEAK